MEELPDHIVDFEMVKVNRDRQKFSLWTNREMENRRRAKEKA